MTGMGAVKSMRSDVATTELREITELFKGAPPIRDEALCRNALEITRRLGENIPHRFPEKRIFEKDLEEGGVRLKFVVLTDTWVGESLPNVFITLYRFNQQKYDAFAKQFPKDTLDRQWSWYYDEISERNPGYASNYEWNPDLAMRYFNRVYDEMKKK